MTAAEALVAAATALGIEAHLNKRADGGDVSVAVPGGSAIDLEVKSASLVSTAVAAEQLRRWASRPRADVVGVIVADRITAEAREHLTRSGWGWLDLRGHLRLAAPGLLIDADVPALSDPEPDRSGLVGQVGIELAALLLLEPAKRTGVRGAAATLSRAPSSVSDAFRAMRAADLVDNEGTPAVPALFWELVERWKPESRDLAGLPQPNRGRDNTALGLGLDDVESTTGWALTDTVAAATYGAPVGMRADHPRDFYVPDRRILRRAVQILGPATTPSSRAGRVRLAPVFLACARRVDGAAWAHEHWPLANPLFVALDLARDPGRGREILGGWTPMKPWHRVW
ncbi:hypothetical protein BJF78_16820 [Pseudonocardia sp. CNS-139]|nr:hypothetical protein BJF78_16820 [Pseudonocardia sp. CNS-139]